MKKRQRPLLEEEIPEEYRHLVDCDSQRLDKFFEAERSARNRTVIDVKCPVCDEVRVMAIQYFRSWIKGDRGRQFPGTHRKCRYSRVSIQNGYRMIYKKDHPFSQRHGYIGEHILVMEGILGRYVDRESESVHHINGDCLDNSPSNLQLRKRYHGKGQVWKCGDCGSQNVLADKLK